MFPFDHGELHNGLLYSHNYLQDFYLQISLELILRVANYQDKQLCELESAFHRMLGAMYFTSHARTLHAHVLFA